MGVGLGSDREGSFWRLRPARACLASVCMHVWSGPSSEILLVSRRHAHMQQRGEGGLGGPE